MKAAYGALIRFATKSTYGDAKQRTYVHAARVPRDLPAPAIERVRRLDDGTELLALPRYEQFTPLIAALLARGVRVIDIAGNRRVVLTALARGDFHAPPEAGRVLFSAPIATDSARQRLAIEAEVEALGQIVDALRRQGATLEHVYDF